MRIVVTGAAGFVGPHAARALRHHFPSARIIGTSRDKAILPDFDEIVALDICDAQAVQRVMECVKPTHVLHLAGIAAPGQASSDPGLAWQVNVFGTINIARAMCVASPGSVLAHVGSGLVYGQNALSGVPIDETVPPAPMDDYGVTKIAADLAVGAMTRKGLHAIRLRPFNHTGPGQGEDYVVPAFAMQIARIEAGRAEPVLRVGNLDAERDFLDVRDVASAYALALSRAQTVSSGAIFNLASGNARRIGSVLEALLSLSDVPVRIEQDETRMRPSDIPTVVGNAARARSELGWEPRYDFELTLQDILDDCRQRVGQNVTPE